MLELSARMEMGRGVVEERMGVRLMGREGEGEVRWDERLGAKGDVWRTGEDKCVRPK